MSVGFNVARQWGRDVRVATPTGKEQDTPTMNTCSTRGVGGRVDITSKGGKRGASIRASMRATVRLNMKKGRKGGRALGRVCVRDRGRFQGRWVQWLDFDFGIKLLGWFLCTKLK